MSTITQAIQTETRKALTIQTSCPTGLTIEVTIKRSTDDYFYNATSNSFVATESRTALVETPAGSGEYILTLDVTGWLDALYVTRLYVENVLADTNDIFVDGSLGAPTGFDKKILNHNLGTKDALRYVTSDGSPVEGAKVYVFLESTFDPMAPTAFAIGVTETLPDGRWKDNLLVDSGNYVIIFHKPNMFGPDQTNVSVV